MKKNIQQPIHSGFTAASTAEEVIKGIDLTGKTAINTTPQRWLTQKRLELAHHQIFEQKRKPTDVYFEAGFENLSHFSFAFKKQFGYNPSNALH